MEIPQLSIEQALARLTADLATLPAEGVPLPDALGRVLAEAVSPRHPLPPFDNSAMDGYAVRAADLAAVEPGSPARLTVVGEAAAGSAELPEVGAGQAARITTGAPVPPGADAVVPVEETDQPGPMSGQELPAEVWVRRAVAAGDYVRRAGQDMTAGEVVLRAGRQLGPADIGLLAAVGVAEPTVRVRPRVAVFSTGDEVVDVGEELRPGQIRDSNGHMLAAFVQAAGGEPLRLGVAPDTSAAVVELLDRAVDEEADLILTSGGVSMGAHDFVREVLAAKGELAFWKVNIRPGKPLAHGRYEGVPFLGLPGNPVSAWVTFAIFVQPVLDALLGRERGGPAMVQAELEEAVESDGRESYLRAKLWRRDGSYRTRLTGSQDSGILSSVVEADGLLHLPSGVTRCEPGETVAVWLMGTEGMMNVDFARQR